MDSRPASPEQHLWSSILDSVSSSRAIPSKNVLILGEPSSGKSTIARALLQRAEDRQQQHDPSNEKDQSKHDFALGYDWADVRDEADEDTLARLSVYTVPSSSPAHLALVPHFLPPKSALPNTVAVVLLDWTRPWTFIDQLHTWLAWINQWAKADKSREADIVRDEGRERMQAHLQHYAEPTPDADPLPLTGNALTSAILPLSQGVFTDNPSGVPIIVVCTKADLIDEEPDAPGLGAGMGIIKGKGGEWEERTDGVMQVLRTICLKYGAALFYTSLSHPPTMQHLRSYALHLLFMPPAPAPDTPPAKNIFPFSLRPNVLDRDRIIVPAGWDSWGKIVVVRDGFDCTKWGDAWDRELESADNSGGGAREMFRVLIGAEENEKPPTLPPLIVTEPEQVFLSKHFEVLSKDKDPRRVFGQPTAGEFTSAGVVGPLGGQPFAIPLERPAGPTDTEDIMSRLGKMGAGPRRDTRNPATGNPLTAGPQMNGTTTRPPAAIATPAPGQSQHEVLQRFFATLLGNRNAAAGTEGSNMEATAEGGSVAHAPTDQVAEEDVDRGEE